MRWYEGLLRRGSTQSKKEVEYFNRYKSTAFSLQLDGDRITGRVITYGGGCPSYAHVFTIDAPWAAVLDAIEQKKHLGYTGVRSVLLTPEWSTREAP